MINNEQRMIKELRERLGLSQREFGRLIGRSGAYISQVESGRLLPSHDTIAAIARVFGKDWNMATTAEGNIAERLKKARKSRDYTQTDLAKAVRCNRNTISTAERGETVPSPDIIRRIANCLWINEAWLRFGIGTMERSELIAEVLNHIRTNPEVKEAVKQYMGRDEG